MPRGLKVSHPMIANMKLFINISNLYELEFIYIMTFRCSTLEYFKMIVLHFSMQGKDNIEHSNGKCHMFTF